MKTTSFLSALAVLPLFLAACASEPEIAQADSEVVSQCEEGDTNTCKCEGGTSGSKTCSSKGKWGACACNDAPAPAPPPPAEIKPVCTELKACDGASAPTTYTPASALDVKFEATSKEQLLQELRAEVAAGSLRSRYLAAALAPRQAGEPQTVTVVRELLETNVTLRAAVSRHVPTLGFGTVESYRSRFPVPSDASQVRDATVDVCAPSLRIKLAKITVSEEDDDVANDEVYCSISAQAKDIQELRITPKTKALDEGDSQTFSGDETVVWGQDKPRAPDADLTIKYDCFETDSSTGYAALIKAAADAAKKYGSKVVSGENAGYLSTGADLIGAFLPQILALDSDDHLFKATQTIPAASQKALAKGATWTLRKKGTHLWSDWDWTLTMEAWGCSVNGTK